MTSLWPSFPEAALAWREYFSTAVSPSLPAHISSPVSLGSSNSTCPTCSPGHPYAGGLSSPPTSGTTEVSKNNLVWCCLHTALISFVFTAFFVLFLPERRRVYSVGSHAVALSFYILFVSFLCPLLPHEAFRSTSLPPWVLLFLLCSIMALTYLPVTFKWNCPAGRLINTHNIA